MNLGLKSSVDRFQLLDRLQHKPSVIEFFIQETDLFGEGKKNFEKYIQLIIRTFKKKIDFQKSIDITGI